MSRRYFETTDLAVFAQMLREFTELGLAFEASHNPDDGAFTVLILGY